MQGWQVRNGIDNSTVNGSTFQARELTVVEAGRTDEAVRLQEQVLADRRHLVDTDHPDTLMARHDLAAVYWNAGRPDEAVEMVRQAVADLDRVLGPDHPDTVPARANLLEVAGGPQPEAAQDSSSRSPSSEGEPGSAV
ncbi:tetratricopeptide repeat protein [Streptomyces sp. LS1784]|uniref:tetratricopeptide repeat protein n=1 Tax=Streptomyces sp. LS1784 TaxID=2851533 RepID=UPI001CCD2845|nr:tetratricopeptide repeat protein [Streptomyces sp. LS1784]